ncbi:hypothetical protein [Shewanella algae]|nr:hypothetical protein [Shewanella algae]MBO2596146.1 hypothetical protein [Shewanella algae]
MMKHLKKVLLFRVGFDKKVSLVDKFFICDMPSMIKGKSPNSMKIENKNGSPKDCLKNAGDKDLVR